MDQEVDQENKWDDDDDEFGDLPVFASEIKNMK